MSLALAMLMTIGMMPMTVLASETGQGNQEPDPPAQAAETLTISMSKAEGFDFNNANVEVQFFNDQNVQLSATLVGINEDNNYTVVNQVSNIPDGTHHFVVKTQSAGQGLYSSSVKFSDDGNEYANSEAIDSENGQSIVIVDPPRDIIINIVVGDPARQQGGGEGGQQGPRTDVAVKLAGTDINGLWSWNGTPMVDDYNRATSFDLNETWKGTPDDRGEYRGGINVNIIPADQQWKDSWYMGYSNIGEDGLIHFPPLDGVEPGQGDRKIIVATQWSETIDKIIINEIDYSGSITRESDGVEEYFKHFGSQMIYSEITVPAAALDNGVELYDIKVAVRPITRDECFVGNFRWSSDEKMSESDTYVGNAIMELQSITFDGKTYTDIAKCPWVGDYSPNHLDYSTGAYMGDMFVPAGAEVTMKITPYQGYQVQSFKLSGGQFTAEDEPGVFTFTVGKGNFHLGGKTIKVEDKVEATATSVSDVKATITAGGDYAAGSANLSISNASPSDDKKSEFATAAGEQEVDLIGGENAYLAIDLEQVIYKANSAEDPNKENETWTQDIHDLGNGYSDVTMKFGNDVDVSTVVLLHNIGDGEDFETIRPISYDEANHTATFRIKSFSTFAIAKAHTKTTPVTPSDTNTNTNCGGSGAPAAAAVDTVPKTAESFPMALLIILSIASLGTMTTVVVKRRRM